MLRKDALLLPLVAVLALAGPAQLAPGASARIDRGEGLLPLIAAKRKEAWRWQRLMGKPLSRHAGSAARAASLAYRRWMLRLWTARAARARRRAIRPPHLEAWLCIHRYEGRWDDPNPPCYGGLQMDLGFQRAYGRHLQRTKGTADNWTPLEQMWVAERAHTSGRGFYPWPSTARYCGLSER